jgi:hypothetical protein
MHMSSERFSQKVSTRTINADAVPNEGAADRTSMHEVIAFVALVGSGVALRLACHDLPNFAPVAAMALFAGYYFRSRLVAFCVPLSVMAISDCFVGGYNWAMMALVYSMLALPVALSSWLRKGLSLRNARATRAAVTLAGLFASGLVSSLLFFIVTNFGVWCLFGYERSLAGLIACYEAAIPFFRYTLAGDLFFSVVLFGTYAIALSWARHREPAAEAAQV